MLRHFFLTLFALHGASLLNTARAETSSVSYNALALTSSFPDEVSPSCKENFSKEQLEKAYDILDKRGIPLASNQVEYSILNRKAEKEGLLRSCQDRDVKVVAYSPLKALKTTEIAEKYVIMNKLCDFIGQVNSGGKSSVSVMLNYCVTKGTIPIPGVKKVEQIADIENAMGWTLDEESLLTID